MGHTDTLGRVLGWLDAARRGLRSIVHRIAESLGLRSGTDLHTRVTVRALVDAVLPETPVLGAELGPEHVPGGLAIDLDRFVVTYVDDGFQLGLPHVGPHGNIPLIDAITHVLDAAALKLVDRHENESGPRSDRPKSLFDPGEASPARIEDAAGTFSKLSRRDRLRAIGILDDFEFEISLPSGDTFEFDAGLVGQLVIGFTEMIYYSEWDGYDEFTQAPSARVHPNDPVAVQSWRQTDFPGVANGYVALRGYVGTDEGPLGDGEVWTTIAGNADGNADADESGKADGNADADGENDGEGATPVRITHGSGSFRENEYDTSGYEDPHPE